MSKLVYGKQKKNPKTTYKSIVQQLMTGMAYIHMLYTHTHVYTRTNSCMPLAALAPAATVANTICITTCVYVCMCVFNNNVLACLQQIFLFGIFTICFLLPPRPLLPPQLLLLLYHKRLYIQLCCASWLL